MTKTKSRILAALALTTALTAPALIAPMLTAPAAVAAAPTVSGVQDFSDLAAKVTPAVVNVSVTMKVSGDDEDMQMSSKERGEQNKQMEEFMQKFAERFGMPMQPGQPGAKPQRPAQKGQAVGTGFIVREDGIIVTNYHVVEGAQRITVTTSGDDPTRYEARVIGGDATADLAVLDVEATGLPTVALGSSEDLELGQQVVAIGYALALEGGPTVTAGIVSALDRTIEVPDPNCDACAGGRRIYARVIQTDAAINPGNSGGPLLEIGRAHV